MTYNLLVEGPLGQDDQTGAAEGVGHNGGPAPDELRQRTNAVNLGPPQGLPSLGGEAQRPCPSGLPDVGHRCGDVCQKAHSLAMKLLGELG